MTNGDVTYGWRAILDHEEDTSGLRRERRRADELPRQIGSHWPDPGWRGELMARVRTVHRTRWYGLQGVVHDVWVDPIDGGGSGRLAGALAPGRCAAAAVLVAPRGRGRAAQAGVAEDRERRAGRIHRPAARGVRGSRPGSSRRSRRPTRSSSAGPTSTCSAGSPTSQEARRSSQTKEPDKREKLVEYLLDHPDYRQELRNQWTVLLIGRKQPGAEVDRGGPDRLAAQAVRRRPALERDRLRPGHGQGLEQGERRGQLTLAHLEFGAVPLTSITTRVFLGQQIQCTQCHDHPSNDWKQADFWGINAFFKGMQDARSRPRPTPPAPRSTTTPS